MISTVPSSLRSTRRGLLTKECPDPVSEPAAEHRVAIFARGNEQVSIVVESAVNGLGQQRMR